MFFTLISFWVSFLSAKVYLQVSSSISLSLYVYIVQGVKEVCRLGVGFTFGRQSMVGFITAGAGAILSWYVSSKKMSHYQFTSFYSCLKFRRSMQADEALFLHWRLRQVTCRLVFASAATLLYSGTACYCQQFLFSPLKSKIRFRAFQKISWSSARVPTPRTLPLGFRMFYFSVLPNTLFKIL